MNRSERKALMDKFNGLTNALEAETKCKYICLENPLTNMENPLTRIKLEDLTKDYIFQVSHLLLQTKHYNPADKFYRQVRKVSENWMGGATRCGDVLWNTYMFNKMSEIAKNVNDKKWSEAFGSVMGLFLYMNCDMQFVNDHKIDLDSLAAWFSQYSDYWLQILEQSDKILGLDCVGGLPGGYRAPLLELLRKQQANLNRTLNVYDQGMMEEYECQGGPPVVEIFDKAGKLIGEVRR